MSRARCTTAPAPAAARPVASVESESMTTSSSTRGTSDTRAWISGPTTPATVRSSFLAGMTTLIRTSPCRLRSSSSVSGQSVQSEVRRRYQASARGSIRPATPSAHPDPQATGLRGGDGVALPPDRDSEDPFALAAIGEHADRQVVAARSEGQFPDSPGTAAEDAGRPAAGVEHEALEVAAAVEEHLADGAGELLRLALPLEYGRYVRKRRRDRRRVTAEAVDATGQVVDVAHEHEVPPVRRRPLLETPLHDGQRRFLRRQNLRSGHDGYVHLERPDDVPPPEKRGRPRGHVEIGR